MEAEARNIATGSHIQGAGAAGEVIPLSLSQREVWLDSQAWPSSCHLHIGGAVFLVGRLEMELFRRSLSYLVKESEALRLIPGGDGQQLLLADAAPNLEIVEFPAGPAVREQLSKIWDEDIKRPFADGRSPWRFVLYRVDDNFHGLSLHYHHTIMDGWGTSLVLQRWTSIYNQLNDGQPYEPMVGSYLEFVKESNDYLSSATFDKDLAHWQGQVPELPAALVESRQVRSGQRELPATHLVAERVARSAYDRIAEASSQRHWTTFAIFLVAMAVYFGRISGRNEVLVGIPSLNRNGKKAKSVPGMFVGVMAVPVRWKDGDTLAEILDSVSASIRSGLRHARLPLSELGRKLGVVKSGRDGVFDLLLSFERQDYKLAFGDARLEESRQNFAGFSRYPCSLTVCEFNADEDVEVILEASSACFELNEAKLLWHRIVELAKRVSADPECRVADLEIVPNEEVRFLSGLIQPPGYGDSALQPFTMAFCNWAQSTPDVTCLRWDQGQLTYASTLAAARIVAADLRSGGIGRNDVVAMAIERSPDMVVALLGIALAGAAFLPLDPDAPQARLEEILHESQAKAFLIRSASAERMGALHGHVMLVDRLAREVPAVELPRVLPDDLAYVLFTSGSTGKPKGVGITHRALAARLNWLTKFFDVSAADCGGQGTQITFDPSLVEWCLPLTVGASVALPPPGRLLPESLAEFAGRHGVTFMAFVPSTLSRFVEALAEQPRKTLRVACCGGEVLSPELVRRYLQVTGARLFNVYGPTEATIFATAWPAVRPEGEAALPIGHAIEGARIYVLDANRKLLPAGVPGEIYIGGDGVAQGYLHRPELTAQAFFDDPYLPGHRMYKTGDRGWMAANGMLHFLGRLDRQVKLRGYRIELGEIEAALCAIEGVSAGAAKLVERDGKAEILGWVASSVGVLSSEVLKALRQRLPAYMVPSAVAVLPHLPESGTGKIDYAALPLPLAQAPAGSGRGPENELERQLLSLWQQALKSPNLTVEDNFFDAGGDSLAAIAVLSGIEKLIGRRVPMYLLSERPTVEGLAASLGEDSAPNRLLVALTDDKTTIGRYKAQGPLYLAASGHGDLLRFQTLATALAGIVEVRMLQPPVTRSVARTVDLANLYAEAIRNQGVKTCYLAGFSVGGLAALETANALQRAGVDVRGLFLIDTIYPSRLWGGTALWRLTGWLVKHLHIQDLSMNGRRLGAMLGDSGLISQVMAVSGYRATKFLGSTHLIKSAALAAKLDHLLFLGWRLMLGRRLLEYTVQGMHGSMFDPANVGSLAKVIRVATTKEQPPLGHSADFPVRHA